MKKFTAFLLIFMVCVFTPKVKALERYSTTSKKCENNATQVLYKEEQENIISVFNNKSKKYISNHDVFLISQVVYAESRGEPYEGKVAVASVILNRLMSPDFPNTVEGVIKQKNAFSCIRNGRINVRPNQECYNAVLDAIKGNDPTSKAVFFYNPKTSTCSWMKNSRKTNIHHIGHHVFFAIKYN